jgi:hypothetical protein
MRLLLGLVSLLAVLVLFPSAAHAQDEPKLGLTMGYPSAIGVLWHVADRVAIRPEATFSGGSSESSSSNPIVGTDTSLAPSDNWQLGVGVSALFYLKRVEALRTYLAPRFAYSRLNTSTNTSGGIVSSTSDGWAYTTSGSFGAQYSLGRHFGVFGELGVSYTASTTRTSFGESITNVIGIGLGGPITTTSSLTVRSELHAHNVSSRSGAGIIFYF